MAERERETGYTELPAANWDVAAAVGVYTPLCYSARLGGRDATDWQHQPTALRERIEECIEGDTACRNSGACMQEVTGALWAICAWLFGIIDACLVSFREV